MGDDFKKKMRGIDARRKHIASQEFAGVRQWYYSLPVEDRQRLRQDIQSLIDAADRIKDFNMFVKVQCTWSQHDEEGNLLSEIGAYETPEEFLRAINQWDETDDQS